MHLDVLREERRDHTELHNFHLDFFYLDFPDYFDDYAAGMHGRLRLEGELAGRGPDLEIVRWVQLLMPMPRARL
jgi:hypothetical protein